MAELKTKPADETVRIIDRPDGTTGMAGIQELERRVEGLQNDIAILASMATARQGEGYRTATPSYFGALDRFGPVPPGMVPPPPRAGPQTPLFGYGAPAYNIPAEAVTMKDFCAQPAVTRAPGVNIVDAGEEFIVQVELPAIQKKDIELLGSERSLTVTAQLRPANATDGTVLLGEVAPTTYRRTILLPSPCNTQKCKASLKDGVLTLNVPKRDPTNGMRRIDVAYG